MENKVLAFLRRYDMVKPGERIICAVSGGADSVALLWCMWMLREKLDIRVEAAHFNHNLRGAESDRDEQFVRQFCEFHDIPLHVGSGTVVPGKKGLEAAARDTRYAYLRSLGGTIATAHTADDNAETVLLHLIRGSGLRGLGGITPKSEGLIRPMLDVTRDEVESYLAENWISHVEDSSNAGDAFLRNRIRHSVMPLLKGENPSLALNLSAMARRLRQDEDCLAQTASQLNPTDVASLREAHPALRRRALDAFLKKNGMSEPNASHIAQAESLVFSDKPSAFARFPGGLILRRNYGKLTACREEAVLEQVSLNVGESVVLSTGITVRCEETDGTENTSHSFCVCAEGPVIIRPRQAGDEITLSGGTKSLKKLFIDRKIPAYERPLIPVAADSRGVIGICGIGANLARTEGDRKMRISFVISGENAE